MPNNAALGMTMQKVICDMYGIEPHPNALSQFQLCYRDIYKDAAEKVARDVFGQLNLVPVKCLTLAPSPDKKEKWSPHNFLLSDGTTLSIRTTQKGDKVAPRVVGQCGLKTFNDYFADISGFEITQKEEIKDVVFHHIHQMLPIFIEYIFSSDYTVWVQCESETHFTYLVFDKSKEVDIELSRECFSFTRDAQAWSESTTLKYKSKSLAEIQIHKNRTFKFRFIMGALSELLAEQRETTETLGISAEVAICNKFNLNLPSEYIGRYSTALVSALRPVINEAFNGLPYAIKSTGAEQGARGENSKCSYDFVLSEGKTLSVKTNKGKMVCPPEVGQPSAGTCYKYFKEYIDGDKVTPVTYKQMVYQHIAEIMPIFVQHLFDSDYLLWIYIANKHYEFRIFEKNFAKDIVWYASDFSFSKPTIDEWNESNTVYYKGIRIGEFQVHNNRSCYKFRFELANFSSLATGESEN